MVVRIQWVNLQRALLVVLGREYQKGLVLYLQQMENRHFKKVASAGFTGFRRQWDASVTSGEGTLGWEFEAGMETVCDHLAV